MCVGGAQSCSGGAYPLFQVLHLGLVGVAGREFGFQITNVEVAGVETHIINVALVEDVLGGDTADEGEEGDDDGSFGKLHVDWALRFGLKWMKRLE